MEERDKQKLERFLERADAILDGVEEAESAPTQPGTRIGGYRLLRRLGHGGMGTVYLAEAAAAFAGFEPGQEFALKIIHPHLLGTRGFFKRFLREAEAGKQVRHQNVVRTFDVDALIQDGETFHYLVMEYVEGRTLRSLLGDLGRVPEQLCRHIGREIAKALVAIHAAGFIHRDLKPENVLITRDEVVKVMDLGVAGLTQEAIRLSQTADFVGSVAYASPEQLDPERGRADGRADLYALGLVLYELATGKHPFRADDFVQMVQRQLNEEARPAAELNPQLSPMFEEILKTLLAKDREERFSSATEILDVLELGETSQWWPARAQAIRAATHHPLRRIRIPRETALHGREAELAQLRALYRKAKGGDGQVLLVEGEAGIGKTRLVDAFVEQLREGGEDLNFLFGSCQPSGAATAAGAFSTAYREHFGGEGLEETLKGYLTTTPLLIPAFAALLRGEPPPRGEERLTKDSLQTVFAQATKALAAERPTVVLVDDLHFAPEEGRALFAALSLEVPEHRIMLAGTALPGLSYEWVAGLERTHHASRLPLSRLGPKDLARLLTEVLRSKRLAEELSFLIARKSDGNPFFVFEIIRGLRERGLITRQADGTWVKTQAIESLQLPSSVMDLIQARLSDLDREQRSLLEVAACLGFEFDPLLAGEVSGMGRILTLQRLAEVEKTQRLVRSAGLRFVFDHRQVQEALYEGLPELLRREYHAALAEALEKREDAAERPPLEIEGGLAVGLCDHFLRGARGNKALRYLAAALDHLERGYLNEPAVRLADRALEMEGLLTGSERIETLLRKARRLDLLGHREAEGVAVDEAMSIAEETGEALLRARAHRALGVHLSRTSRYEEAYDVLTKCAELASQAQARALAARATGDLGNVLLFLGRHDEARENYRRSLALSREIGDRHGEATATGSLAGVSLDLGLHEDAREHYERAHAIFREIGDRRGAAIALGNLGNVLTDLGAYEAAVEHHEQALALSREIGDRRAEGIVLTNLGSLEAARGNPVQAKSALEESLALLRQIGARRAAGYALHGLAALAEGQGDPVEAARFYGEALALRREIDYRLGVADTLVALGRLEAIRGREQTATALLDEALELGRNLKAPGAILLAAAYRAPLPGGDVAVALSALAEYEDRVARADRMEARFALWSATQDAAHLDEAYNLLGLLRDRAPEKCRETMIENVPLHRDIVRAWEGRGLLPDQSRE